MSARPGAAPDGELRLAGYAALFDKPDGAKDVIRNGAFARTLSERRDPLPLFWQHNPDKRIGWVERALEDDRGLRVVARIDNPHGKAAALLRARRIDGLSFGFRARAFRNRPDGRELAELDLFEISLVTHPLHPDARVHLIG